MKLQFKVGHETRTVEHVERLSVTADETFPDEKYTDLHISLKPADDGGTTLVLTETEL